MTPDYTKMNVILSFLIEKNKSYTVIARADWRERIYNIHCFILPEGYNVRKYLKEITFEFYLFIIPGRNIVYFINLFQTPKTFYIFKRHFIK